MSSALNAGVLSKFRGCLIGSLLGDCLGAPFEGDAHISKGLLGKYFNNLLSGESLQVFSYTDDTAMTLSVANSLIEHKRIEPKDMAQKFVSEFYRQRKRGYGENVVTVFKALKDTEFKDVYLPAKLQFNGSGSYGNGAAMRIAPIALFGNMKPDDFLTSAADQCSKITHNHPNGYNGAKLQCFAVHSALKADSTQVLDPVHFISELEEKMKSIETQDSPFCKSLNKIKEIYLQKQEDMSPEEIAGYLGHGVAAHESVPTAIYSFLKGMKPLPDFECSNPFTRTIYFAISVGGDTDTIASMAGGIAGAYYGVEGIPEELQRRCESIDLVKNLAEKLHTLTEEESEEVLER